MDVYSLMPGPAENPQPLNGLELLLLRLRIVHREAGQPTYAAIGKQIGMSASTVCRIFNADTVPAWHKLRAVLQALDIPEKEISTVWLELWRGAENAFKSIPVRLDANLTTPGTEHCSSCGAWLADAKIHNDLHHRIDQLELFVQRLTAEM